jgi:hypothetical protein
MPSQVNLFKGKASNILRVLLVNYPKTWKIRALAKEAEVSLGWASKVANALVREKIAIKESKRAELKIMLPYDLLRRWANYTNFIANTKFIEFYSIEQDISKLFSNFRNANGPRYALTGISGTLLVSPNVRPTDVYVYVESEKDALTWSKFLNLLPVEKQGNIHFAIVEDEGIFYGVQEIEGIKIVSDVQLYVDLLNYHGRGLEAAESVLDTIEKRWKMYEEKDVFQGRNRSF